MRYILNDSGFIQAVSFNNLLECQNKSCTEYTGTIPTGYETLAIWSETANINAYKIVDGNLTYDSEEDARLQSLWAIQENENNISIEVGTTTTGEAGTNAIVTNSGTTKNAVFNFVIPKGEQGIQGPQGIQGVQGIQGEIGITGKQGPIGQQGPIGIKGDKGDTGERGVQGVQGIQGLKGEKGDTGESGITTQISGFFTMSVDSEGNLYAHHSDENNPPEFEYDTETGNLYFITDN